MSVAQPAWFHLAPQGWPPLFAVPPAPPWAVPRSTRHLGRPGPLLHATPSGGWPGAHPNSL